MHRLKTADAVRRMLVALVAAGSVLATASASAMLLSVRHSVNPAETRIVLDLSAPSSYRHRLELQPPQVVLEIPGGNSTSGISPREIESPLVSGVRVSRLRGPATLVVVDLKRPCGYRTFTLPAAKGQKPRIVIDLFEGEQAPADSSGLEVDAPAQAPAAPLAGSEQPGSAAGSADTESAAEVAIPAAPDSQAVAPGAALPSPDEGVEEFVPDQALRVQPGATPAASGSSSNPEISSPPPVPAVAESSAAPATSDLSTPPAVAGPSPAEPARRDVSTQASSEAATKGARKRVIAIDAGHGGEDTGARRGNIEEKRICLDFAERLAAAINAVDGYQAFLTRSSDVFLPLRRRYQIAEEHGADVFVSIHANAAYSRAATGTEVFFLSLDGASDESARDLAQKENESDQIGGVSPEAEEDLASILRDLRRSDALRRSSFLAEAVLDELQEIPGVESRGVKQAGFTVLKSPKMPSILVETGFLSNAHERSLLTDPKYQDVFVHRVRDGLLSFFSKYGLAQP